MSRVARRKSGAIRRGWRMASEGRGIRTDLRWDRYQTAPCRKLHYQERLLSTRQESTEVPRPQANRRQALLSLRRRSADQAGRGISLTGLVLRPFDPIS